MRKSRRHPQEDNGREYRGFAAMSMRQRCQIAAAGGVEAHRRGTARQWTREQAIANGRKGGQVMAAKREAARQAQVSFDAITDSVTDAPDEPLNWDELEGEGR